MAFKINPKREKAFDDWAEEVLKNGTPLRIFCMEEHGTYNWCFQGTNGVQRFGKNVPEHIQRKLGVSEEDIVKDLQLPHACYWHKKAKAALERDAS